MDATQQRDGRHRQKYPATRSPAQGIALAKAMRQASQRLGGPTVRVADEVVRH
jgi:hypothetical protein